MNRILRRLPWLAGLTAGRHWWQYKVPPLLAIAYALIAQYRLAPAQSYGALVVLLISVVFLAMQAHAINDAFDIEYDRRSGKHNAMAMLSPRWRALLYLLLGVAGLAPWLGLRLGAWPLVLLALIVALPLIYAAPPLRLKERGVWGLIADAAYAHVIPTLFVIALFSQPAEIRTPGALLFIVAATLWSFCFGLRGILIHQFEDLPHDVMAGVKTFVTAAGAERAHGIVSRVIFPAELAALGVVAIAVWTLAPVLVYVLAGYAAIFMLARAIGVWPMVYDPAPLKPGTPVSLMGVYTVWAPVVLAVLLASGNRAFVPLLLLHVALFWKPVTREFEATARILGAIVPGLPRALYSKFKWHIWVRLRKVPKKVRAARRIGGQDS